MQDFQEQREDHGWRVATLHTAKENMASPFATSTEKEIERLMIDKDAENTKRTTKVAKEPFHEYLRGKKIGNRETRNS